MMEFYLVEWRLSPSYEWKTISTLFSTENDAKRFAHLTLTVFMREDEVETNSRVKNITVFKMPYWSSLNPYIATFSDGNLVRITKNASGAMFIDKLIITNNKYGLEICFWDAGDIERAKVLAQSMYDGWVYAKGVKSEETV